MKKPLITIVIPLYNNERYISRCINSIKCQSMTSFEVIIIDDGSSDQSYQKCIDSVDGDQRFKVYQIENAGVSAARNVALRHALGDSITFIDSDDLIPPDYLMCLYTTKLEFAADIVCCGYREFDGSIITENLNLPARNLNVPQALDAFSPYFYSSVWGKLFDKTVLDNLFFCEDLFYSEDSLFYVQAVLNSKRIYWCDRTYYIYFKNSGGALQNKNADKYFSDFIARCRILKLYSENKIDLQSAEFWLLNSAVNVKWIFLQNKISHDDRRFIEVNRAIDKYKNRFRRDLKLQCKISLLAHPRIFGFFYRAVNFVLRSRGAISTGNLTIESEETHE